MAKVSADVKIEVDMKNTIRNKAQLHHIHYADMFRLLLVLGLNSLIWMESGNQDIEYLVKKIRGDYSD